MTDDRVKFLMRIDPDTDRKVKTAMPLSNCRSQNEFVEKALRFYVGYLHTDKSSAFLPRVLLDVLEGSLGVFCGRVGKLLFNLSVEHCITNHLMAEDVDLNAEDYRKLRGYSVREVTETQGSFSFRDTLRLHRKW